MTCNKALTDIGTRVQNFLLLFSSLVRTWHLGWGGGEEWYTVICYVDEINSE